MNTKLESNKNVRKQQGFTLIEILVVIGLIALLAAIIIVAINPAKRFAEGRNSQRQANLEAISNAIGQKLADDKGVIDDGNSSTTSDCLKNVPQLSTDVALPITSDTNGKTIGTGTDDANLSCLVPEYLAKMPTDPKDNSGYKIFRNKNGRFVIYAPKTETTDGSTLDEYIAVTF